jgi:alpha-1,6-mannosyltransferase
VRRIPLGVDVAEFQPSPARDDDGTLRLVLASRLSREKRPDLAVGAVKELQRRGHRLTLRVAGDGPLRRTITAHSAGGPVELLGFIADRATLAAELARADIALAPGPVETFGLAALEALACGTPVVANVHSALPEVLGDAGDVAASTPQSFANAVERLLQVPAAQRRSRARQRAESFPWSNTVEGFLRAHSLPLGAHRSTAGAT